MKLIISIVTFVLTLNLLLFGYIDRSHSADISTPDQEVIDANNFDAQEFMKKAQEEFKAREKVKIDRFYHLGNERIDFRPVINDIESALKKEEFEILNDLNENTHFVSKMTAIDSDDIEGVLISTSKYKGIERNDMSIMFKKSSWDKVRDVTSNLSGKKLGILKNGQLLFAATLAEAVDSAIGGPIDDILDAKKFIDGFLLAETPSDEQREKDYLTWLEKRARTYPNDMSIIAKLSNNYISKKESDCKKTLHIYTTVLFDDIFRFPYMNEINKRYKQSGNFKEAISTYNKLLRDMKLEPWEEASIRGFLADMLFENGQKEDSLTELNNAIHIVENSSMDYEWIERGRNRDRLKAEFEEKKKGLITTFREMITKIENSE